MTQIIDLFILEKQTSLPKCVLFWCFSNLPKKFSKPKCFSVFSSRFIVFYFHVCNNCELAPLIVLIPVHWLWHCIVLVGLVSFRANRHCSVGANHVMWLQPVNGDIVERASFDGHRALQAAGIFWYISGRHGKVCWEAVGLAPFWLQDKVSVLLDDFQGLRRSVPNSLSQYYFLVDGLLGLLII